MDQITVLSCIEFTAAQLDRLRAVSPRLDLHQISGATPDQVPAALRNRVEILYGWGKHVEEAHLYSRLKWIQTHSAGIDSLIDRPVWHSDVLISSLNGIHATPMAEYALTMMLAFRWKLVTMFTLKQQATWPGDRWKLFIHPELRGQTVGIVGYGAIGRELARQCHALKMEVLAVNRSGRRTPQASYQEPGIGDPDASIPAQIYPANQLLAMIPACDYVVVLAPHTPQTHHLINADVLAQMKPSAVLLNLARGSLIDEAALIKALQQQQIAGAALDVFETEPLPADSQLWHLDNVILSPHVSGFSPHYDERAARLFAENLDRYLHNRPLINRVERERNY